MVPVVFLAPTASNLIDATMTTMPRLCIWLGGGEEQIKGYVTVEATSAGGPVFLRADADFPVYQ